MKIIGIVGWKNNGKTTLTTRLVGHFTAQGLRVSTVKHAHHDVDPDQKGKDSWRHREAGANEVILATARRWAIIHELRDEPEPALETLLAKLAPVDLVFVEGFKRDHHPKIEVHRAERATPLIAREDPTVIALASDDPAQGLGIPVFDLDAIDQIASFITDRLELGPPGGSRR